ncbi:hypothetical protein BBK82_03495 [Lentzea guizhouensis]|uniref:Uncharacterized protein n=1 Tax=Lentzea guizhouensis TaxID=1586287 RepID=A0A1B2HC29_9PSEU|nr:hypothetical protein [Lentzea guizhouensis]ANZ35280.1 hypothetical protein BBK82_03495 [Lentzea guizhouensis]
MKPIVLAAAAILALAGCSSSSTSTLTAEQVTQKLTERIPTVSLTKAYTAEDDPNKLLGRPNMYTSKVAFADSRVPAEGLPDDKTQVEHGGGVEVFPDEAGATARMKQIQEISKNLGGMISEYDYVRGGVLVRVSSKLTPDQAKEYESALAAIQ